MSVVAVVLAVWFSLSGGFLLGFVVRGLFVEQPRRRRRGGDLDLTGIRPRDGWERRNAELLLRDVGARPLLTLIRGDGPEPGVCRDDRGRSFYSAAWLDKRRGPYDREIEQ